MEIYQREIFDQIVRYLPLPEIIVLHGARQVGKTHILYYLRDYLISQGEAVRYLDLEDSRLAQVLDAGVPEFRRYLAEEGDDLADFAKSGRRLYVLIDEIQHLAQPSPFLKLLADHHPALKLVVSGSSSFAIRAKFSDSLVGRTVDFTVYPLSFREFLRFRGQRFDPDQTITAKRLDELRALYEEFAIGGGYPKIALTPDRVTRERHLQQIVDTYVRKDIRDLAAVPDPNKFNRLIEALAAQSAQTLNVAELARTVRLAPQTVERYLFLLEQTYVIRLVRPYRGNVRSEIAKSPKVFFYDSGLMHLLWLKELPSELLGQSFETSIFAELVKRYGPDQVFYWRTVGKQEIDFVLRRGRMPTPIEAKLNFAKSDGSALRLFCQRYQVSDRRTVGLRGEPGGEFDIYPWQL